MKCVSSVSGVLLPLESRLGIGIDFQQMQSTQYSYTIVARCRAARTKSIEIGRRQLIQRMMRWPFILRFAPARPCASTMLWNRNIQIHRHSVVCRVLSPFCGTRWQSHMYMQVKPRFLDKYWLFYFYTVSPVGRSVGRAKLWLSSTNWVNGTAKPCSHVWGTKIK